LDECNVQIDDVLPEQQWDLREEDRHEICPPSVDGFSAVGTDEEGVTAENACEKRRKYI
jgi:hypothetical protein